MISRHRESLIDARDLGLIEVPTPQVRLRLCKEGRLANGVANTEERAVGGLEGVMSPGREGR